MPDSSMSRGCSPSGQRNPLRCAVVGGGIIGVAVARQLLLTRPGDSVTLLEKESGLAKHQTGHNSGVVHAGVYYPPGSLKASLCRRGGMLLREFCERHELPFDQCGKLIIATGEAERPRLIDLHQRALENGVPGIRVVDSREITDIEPHAQGVIGLYSPTTAIADFAAITKSLAEEFAALGGIMRTGVGVTGFAEHAREVSVEARARSFAEPYDLVVVCAGLHSDRLAALTADDADPAIIPFRGEYHALRPERRHLVRGLIYPVPDPRYPFLGVHLTRLVDGNTLVGPNAVLALSREGYRRRDISPRDVKDILAWPGFRRLAQRHWRTGLREIHGSLSARAFLARARAYVPELQLDDVVPGASGVRAQALSRDGSLVDDFRITRRGRVVCVRNAPSPGATSALAIAEHIVRLALE